MGREKELGPCPRCGKREDELAMLGSYCCLERFRLRECDQPPGRSMQVERGHRELGGLRSLDRLEGDNQEFGIRHRRGILVGSADVNRAVRTRAVGEIELTIAEIFSRLHIDQFQVRGIEAQLHRGGEQRLSGSYFQQHVETSAKPYLVWPF